MAIEILEKNYLEILTVSEWAEKMGYSRSHYCRIFKKEFGICPKDQLKSFRLSLIKKEIRKTPTAIGFRIAVNAGLANEKSLHKFLSANFDKNLTALKQELAMGYE
ncbi:MAG: AraC family transcriptional regulator [Gracilimonas sp.]